MTAVLLLASFAVSSTAFTWRECHPAALFPYARAVPESGHAAQFVNPAHLPGGPTLFIDMAYSQPYGLEGLHAGSVRAGGSSRRAGGMLTWSAFGIDGYREETASASAGLAPAGRFRAGGALSLTRLVIDTDEAVIDERRCDFSLSAIASPLPWIEAGISQENIHSLFDDRHSDLGYPGWSAGVAVRPARGFGASWNITRTFFGAVNTLAVSANLLECLSVSGGYSRETNSVAGAVILVIRGMMISYGLRYHSYLGATHSLGVTAALGMPAPEEIDYAARIVRHPVRIPESRVIDLKTCTAEELCGIPGMERPVAERLVKYREIMGPVSRKAMLQMGITSGEFRDMEPYFGNIAPDDRDRKKFHGRKKTGQKKAALPFASTESRKELFRSLVREGVMAGSALRITEIARGSGREALDKKIDGLAFLSGEEKKAAHRACAAR